MPHTDSAGPQPLVSIVILYYKRREIIEQTLRSAVCQDYGNREIVLVDNHSEDDVRTLASAVSPEIKVVELPGNAGACAGRNAGVRASRGEIIVFIDDDVCFVSRSEVRKIVDTFAEKRGIHVLALQVCDPKTGTVRIREWCHTRPYNEYVEREFETNWFGEGASAFRREVFEKAGLYYEPLYYGAEGHDMVVRILDHGFRILHTPDIRVDHWASDSGRSLDRQYYYFTRNFIWMAYKDYTLWPGFCFLVPKILMMFYFAWRTRTYRPVFQAVSDGVRGLGAIRPDRTPISRATRKHLAEHERWRPGLLKRLARHRSRPQI